MQHLKTWFNVTLQWLIKTQDGITAAGGTAVIGSFSQPC